jgi:bacterioferritin-associated ferredoxin
MYVCLCKGLTETDIRQMAPKRELCPDTFKACFGFDDEECCGRCAENVQELIAIAKGIGASNKAEHARDRAMSREASLLPHSVQRQV